LTKAQSILITNHKQIIKLKKSVVNLFITLFYCL
jgi:hypothetical protein